MDCRHEQARVVALISAVFCAAMLPATAAPSPWSFSARVAAGRVVGGTQTTPRLGLEVDLLHAAGRVVGFGVEGGWWEEVGSQAISYGGAGPDDPAEVHQREFALAALVRAHTHLGHSKPYLVAGVGEYFAVHRNRYFDDRIRSRAERTSGLSVGAGISGSNGFF